MSPRSATSQAANTVTVGVDPTGRGGQLVGCAASVDALESHRAGHLVARLPQRCGVCLLERTVAADTIAAVEVATPCAVVRMVGREIDTDRLAARRGGADPARISCASGHTGWRRAVATHHGPVQVDALPVSVVWHAWVVLHALVVVAPERTAVAPSVHTATPPSGAFTAPSARWGWKRRQVRVDPAHPSARFAGTALANLGAGAGVVWSGQPDPTCGRVWIVRRVLRTAPDADREPHQQHKRQLAQLTSQ